VTILKKPTPHIPKVDPSCHRISQDLIGKMRKNHRILQKNTGKIWNMEAVILPRIFRIFSDDFRKDPSGKHWMLLESTEKNPENSRPEYCFQLLSIFRCIPAVSRRTSFTWKALSDAIKCAT
jgi:hypothetical protein